MHKNNLRSASMGITSKGFVLPTVLIVSLIMISALTLTLNVVWSGRQSLKQQFDTQNARNAAISGINIADGCRYGNDIIISDTITASSSPSYGTKDCGRTAATASVNPFLLKPEYGSAVSSFGFSANFIKDSSGAPVLITATGGNKGTSSGSFSKQAKPNVVATNIYAPPLVEMQSVTKSTCSTTITATKDVRDDRSYYIKKFSDGNCWMMTNLAFAGTLYPQIPTGANPTTSPALPSNSISGSGQYGYLYTWDKALSACPAGWRLPTSSEFVALNGIVNGGSTTTSAGLLTNWYAQYAGRFDASFNEQGSAGGYWSSSITNRSTDAYLWYFNTSSSFPDDKDYRASSYSVRCMAS